MRRRPAKNFIMSPKKPRPPARSPGNRHSPLLALGFALGLMASGLGVIGCQAMGENGESAYFRVDGDSTWESYQRLVVVLATPQGKILDTLFNDSVADLNALTYLPAKNYQGGRVLIGIYGYRQGALVFSQGRDFDGESQIVTVIRDTLPAPIAGVIALGGNVPVTPAESIATQDSGKTTPPPVTGTPPKILAISTDTTVSIGDWVPLFAQVQDGSSRLSFAGWDYGNDGRFDDSAPMPSTTLRFTGKAKFKDPGKYACRFQIRTALGKAEAKINVTVLLDPPVADAGRDTSVLAGSTLILHANGKDGFGPIAKREWQIGDQAFQVVTQVDTRVPAPASPGSMPYVLRVTDSDGLTAVDTVLVTVY